MVGWGVSPGGLTAELGRVIEIWPDREDRAGGPPGGHSLGNNTAE